MNSYVHPYFVCSDKLLSGKLLLLVQFSGLLMNFISFCRGNALLHYWLRDHLVKFALSYWITKITRASFCDKMVSITIYTNQTCCYPHVCNKHVCRGLKNNNQGLQKVLSEKSRTSHKLN